METNLSEWVKSLQASITGLLDVDLTHPDNDNFLQALIDIERCTRQLTTAVATRMVVEVSDRGLPGVGGSTALMRYLKGMLRLSGSEAWQRVTDAKAFGVFRSPSGATLTSRHPATTQGQRDGALSVEHSRRIREGMRKIPHDLEPEDREAAEQVLTDTARRAAPEEVDAITQQLLGLLNPDGKLTDDVDRARRRGLRLSRQDADLMSTLTGNLDPATRAMLEVILIKWAAPGFNNPDDELSPRGSLDSPDVDDAVLRECAGRDHRSLEQRQHDAFKALLSWVLAAGNLGENAGMPMYLILTTTLREIEEEAGVATTATGGLVPVKDVLAMAAKTRRYLCLFDHDGRPLHFGRERRTANLDQRLALFAAEHGCTAPNCRIGAFGCEVHHRVRDYAHGGTTDIDELTWACHSDHRRLAENDGVHEPQGWYTIVGVEGSEHAGRTLWVPPASVDPARTPLVNDVQHPVRLLAAAVRRVLARWEAEVEVRSRWLREQAEQRRRRNPHHDDTTTDGDGLDDP